MIVCCVLLGCLQSRATAGDDRWSASLFGTLTTSSKLFPNPNARDEFRRGEFSPINASFSVGADVRTEISAIGLNLGLSAEYITKRVTGTVPNTASIIPIDDGYTAVPVELSGYFRIPVGGETINFYMGGGVGVYFGERSYHYAGVRATIADRELNGGIHVVSGLEYSLTELISVRSEIKFRNVQLESVQEFQKAVTVWKGTTVPLPHEPLPSRIQIDGMNLSLAVVYYFH
jgi:opacity protein-like surface antigen